MTVASRTRRRRRALRALELVFWAAAFLLIGAYAFVYLDRTVYQSYQGWAFDRELAHEPAPVLGFVLHSLRFGNPPEASPSTVGHPTTPQQAVLRTPVEPGAIIGRISIPRVSVTSMLINGTDEEELRRAVGHIDGTAWPGQVGNVGLAGHRDTFFRGLRRIHKGDLVYITTLDGMFEYQVESTRVVEPEDVQVLDASAQPTLTLVTCFPFDYIGSAPHRFIVRARQVSAPSPATSAQQRGS